MSNKEQSKKKDVNQEGGQGTRQVGFAGPNVSDKPSWSPFFVYIAILLLAFSLFFPSLYRESQRIIDLAGVEDLSAFMASLLTVIQPFFLAVLAPLAGHFFTYRLGLKSVVYDYFDSQKVAKAKLKVSLQPALVLGLLYGLMIASFDLIFRPWLPDIVSQGLQAPSLIDLVGSIFYSGVVEEVMLRFGLMTLFLYIISFQARRVTKGRVIFTIVFQTVLFMMAYLPNVTTYLDLTPVVVIRLFVFVGLSNLLFSYLYYRYHIEAAMISHMTSVLVSGLLASLLALIA